MKTPEELAEEYVHAWWGPREDNMTLATRQAFLAGYRQGYATGVGVAVENLVIEQIEENE